MRAWQSKEHTRAMFSGFRRCCGYIPFASLWAKHSGRMSFWTFSPFPFSVHMKAFFTSHPHCSHHWGRVFHIFRFISVSDPSLRILSFLFFPIWAIGFVGGGRGVRLSGFGAFFGVLVGFANLSGGEVSIPRISSSSFFFFGGAVAFYFFGLSGVDVLGANGSHAFQFPLGISGSFLGNAIVIIIILLK